MPPAAPQSDEKDRPHPRFAGAQHPLSLQGEGESR